MLKLQQNGFDYNNIRDDCRSMKVKYRNDDDNNYKGI